MSMNAQTMPPAGPGMSRPELFLQHWRAKILLFLGLRVLARSVFEAILQKQPNDLLALNSMAYDAMQGGHMLQALGYFERARALSQDKSNAHFNHAFVCEELGRLDEAETVLSAAVRAARAGRDVARAVSAAVALGREVFRRYRRFLDPRDWLGRQRH